VFRLDAERFCKLDLRNQNIAGAIVELRNPRIIEVHVLAQDGPTIDSFIVDEDLILCDIVINHHFARPDNDHLAHLLRVQPAHVNVCDDLSRILKAKEDNVIDPFLHVSHALTSDGDRLWVAKPILNDADIVGGEVPERVDVGTDPSEVQTLAVYVAKFAELARFNQIFNITNGRVIDEGVASHDNAMSLGSTSGQFINLGNLRRERLLYEDMFASVEDLLREREMTRSRCCNHHAITPRIV